MAGNLRPLLVRKSHQMLFHRNPESRRLGEQFYGVRIHQISRLEFLRDKDIGWSQPLQYMLCCPAQELDVDNVPVSRVFEEFLYLAPLMFRLLKRMESWKPRTFGQLFIPGYAGRFEWWIANVWIIFWSFDSFVDDGCFDFGWIECISNMVIETGKYSTAGFFVLV